MSAKIIQFPLSGERLEQWYFRLLADHIGYDGPPPDASQVSGYTLREYTEQDKFEILKFSVERAAAELPGGLPR